MNDWKGTVRDMSGGLSGLIASLRSGDPLKIVPYSGYGNQDGLFLSGRVLEDEGILPAEDADTVLESMLNLYRRFETDEVPGALVRARFRGIEQDVATDSEGYFILERAAEHAQKAAKPRRVLLPDLKREVAARQEHYGARTKTRSDNIVTLVSVYCS